MNIRICLIIGLLVIGVVSCKSKQEIQYSSVESEHSPGGRSYFDENSITNKDFEDVQILSEKVQCGFKDGVRWLTLDQGKSWNEVANESSKCSESFSFAKTRPGDSDGIRFWNKNFVYSDDSGKTWNLDEFFRGYYMKGFKFTDDRHGWAVGSVIDATGDGRNSVLFSTTDGGKSWNQINISAINDTKTPIFDVWRKNEREGLIIGYFIWQTQDGGKAWVNISSQLAPESILGVPDSIEFFDSDVGIITSNQGGKYLVSIDGGNSWNSRSAPENVRFWKIIYLNRDKVIAVDGSIYTSSDSGKTWKVIEQGESFTKFSISAEKDLVVFWGKEYLVLPSDKLF